MKTLTTLAELIEITNEIHASGGTVYLRWSRGPEMEGGASMNYATMQQEAGLSALALNGENQDKREWYEAYPRRWAAMQVRSYRFLRIKDADIRAWICIADVAGVGGDGEPCITNVKPLAYLSESLVEEAFTETPLF